MTIHSCIVLPFPPSVWQLYVGTGRRKRKSPTYNAWLEEAGYAFNQQKAEMFVGPVAVDIAVGAPDKRRRDLDNLQKSVLDYCSGKLWEDDSQVHDLRIRWCDETIGCRVYVEPIAGDSHG